MELRSFPTDKAPFPMDQWRKCHAQSAAVQSGFPSAARPRRPSLCNAGSLRIWSRARTVEEIGRDMCRVPAPHEPGLIHYYPFDEMTGKKAFDRVGVRWLHASRGPPTASACASPAFSPSLVPSPVPPHDTSQSDAEPCAACRSTLMIPGCDKSGCCQTTPARAPAAAADRTQRPDATCEGENG